MSNNVQTGIKPPNPISVTSQHKIVPIYEESHNLINKPGFVLHRHQIPWGSVQNSIWHLQILWGKFLFLQSRNPLPDWCIFPEIHQENFSVQLKKSLPYKVLSNRRWSGDKIYQSHKLSFGSGSGTDHEEKDATTLPKGIFYFFLFSHVIPLGLKEGGDVSITQAWFPVTEEAQGQKQLLIAMWERDVLAGPGGSGMICPENLS